jgi:molybdenum cofactor guanylyltransferase
MHPAGYVLAGGYSRRMGTDKALVEWKGRTLLETAAARVAGITGTVTLVAPAGRYEQLGYRLIADLHPGRGPLAGLEAALHDTRRDWILVLACDLPKVSDGLLRRLVRAAEDDDGCQAVVARQPPSDGGQLQPLCALYHRRSLPEISANLANGRHKLLETLYMLNWKDILAEPGELANINTAELRADLEHARG